MRAKKLGARLKMARQAAGKSLKQLGEVVGLSSGTVSAVEFGANSLSLPELELLAFYLRTPLSRFWDDDSVPDEDSPVGNLDTERLLSVRHRTVAALLRQGRSEKNLSQKDLAQRTGISSSRIRRYESGETPVPLPELEILADTLGFALDDFADASGPVGEWNTQAKASRQFHELPGDLKEFIANPENHYYMELAQRLSSIPPERLRSLAETLNSIVS